MTGEQSLTIKVDAKTLERVAWAIRPYAFGENGKPLDRAMAYREAGRVLEALCARDADD